MFFPYRRREHWAKEHAQQTHQKHSANKMLKENFLEAGASLSYRETTLGRSHVRAAGRSGSRAGERKSMP